MLRGQSQQIQIDKPAITVYFYVVLMRRCQESKPASNEAASETAFVTRKFQSAWQSADRDLSFLNAQELDGRRAFASPIVSTLVRGWSLWGSK